MQYHLELSKTLRTIAMCAAIGVTFGAFGQSVAAQLSGALVTYKNHCLLPYEGLGGGKVQMRVGPCSQGGARYNIKDGKVMTNDNKCLDHEVAYNMTPDRSNDAAILATCGPFQSQVWYFMKNGIAQNAANPKVCLDIENGDDKSQGRLIVWPCDYNASPRVNQRFFVGNGGMKVSWLYSWGLSSTARTTLLGGGSLLFSNGLRLISEAGSGIVATDGATIVAAGAGNFGNLAKIVAAGGGNILGEGNVKLIGQDGTSMQNAGIRLGFTSFGASY